ncbi:UNVERIFIED_CONTAM: hypothetical protein Scaly_2726300 [Sesamum calycinum]|uniref:Uncharacterized protein n=1 Tax=Sesamum calycinum TaxID=2727403 RepID=A0AAW2J1V2_9LAMI
MLLNAPDMSTSLGCLSSSLSPKIRSMKRVLCSPETNLPHECNFSPATESADVQEISEEKNENSGASKYFVRVQKHKRNRAEVLMTIFICSSSPTFPQLRRIRVPWTTAEEEALKELNKERVKVATALKSLQEKLEEMTWLSKSNVSVQDEDCDLQPGDESIPKDSLGDKLQI